MKNSSILLCGAVLVLALTTSAQARCGCSTNHHRADQAIRNAHAQFSTQFSTSTLLELAQLRTDAAAAQVGGPEAHHRTYSHQIFADSNGQVKQTSRRQLGNQMVAEERIGSGPVVRKLYNLGEAELIHFNSEWTGQQQASKLENKQPHRPAVLHCVQQQYADGADVEVMVLSPGKAVSDEWTRAKVNKMSCDGKFDLVTPAGDRILAALNSGIEHHHLRSVRAHTEIPAKQQQSEVVHEAQLQQQVQAAKISLDNAKRALASEKAAKRSQIDAQLEKAKLQMARLQQERLRVGYERE